MQRTTLVIRFGSLGDVILTSPAVLNLKINAPDSPLLFLTKERFAAVARSLPGVDEVLTVSDHATPVELFDLALRLDDRGVDRIVDLHGNFRSWFLRSIVTANRKAVYPKRRMERIAAARRRYKVIKQPFAHAVGLYNETMAALGGEVYARRPVMRVDSEPPERLQDLLKTGRSVVVLAPGAAHPTKQWPIERFIELSARLRTENRAIVIFAVTANDPALPQLRDLAPAGDRTILVDCPLLDLAAVLSRSSLTISNDSGIGHLSSAVDTPALALFGPTHPVLGFEPRGLRDRILQVDEPCRPCSRHGATPCFREERYCFTRLTVDMVHETAIEMLRSRERRPALLIDRDGTLIVNKHFLSDCDQVDLIDGSLEALRRAQAGGLPIVVLSNQSGVARGYFSCESVERVNARILEMLSRGGVRVDRFYFCPHHPEGLPRSPFTKRCECRKPGAGMAEQAALDLNLDLRRSVVIGDSLVDMNLGRVIGARRMLVRTGYGHDVEARVGADTEVVDNLAEAIRRVVGA